MIPNYISLFRLLFGVFILALLPNFPLTTSFLVLILFVMLVSEISDMGDGYLARKWGQETSLGRLLDPMVDCVYRFFVFLSFASLGWMGVWVCGIFFLNYVLVAYFRGFAQVMRVDFGGARLSGKVKSGVQACAQLLLVMVYVLYGEGYVVYEDWLLLRDVLVWMAVGVTVAATIDYIYYFYRLALKST
jgi:CDP-diacylglycerol--glycerol-3-phosphate 3-phosphatidyltransferase